MLPLAFFLTLLTTISASTTTIQGIFSNTQEGKGTYYSYATYGSGSCSFGTSHPSFVVSKNLWRAALATPQYYGDDNKVHSMSCGMCIEVEGYPSSPVMAYVDNECPNGCSAGPGSIDMATTTGLGGRYSIKWKAVPCPVGSEKIYYKIKKGTNPNWVGILPIANSIPIVKFEFKIGTSWAALENTYYGYWVWASSSKLNINLPLQIRLTAYNGEVLTDTIPVSDWKPFIDPYTTVSGVVSGSGVQFAEVTTSFTQPPVAPSFVLPRIIDDAESGTTSSRESVWGLATAMLAGVGVLAVVAVMLVVVIVVIVMKRS